MKPGLHINRFLNEALAIEVHEAKEAGALGYMARSLVQATLPHKRTPGTVFSRQNGAFTLSIATTVEGGLPYGSIPRLLIAWIATEAVRNQHSQNPRELELGRNLSDFLERIGLAVQGGQRGDITRLREQMRRLFGCFISCTYTDDTLDQGRNLLISDEYTLWWHPKFAQDDLFKSSVTLSKRFFDELIQNPVPIDLRVFDALKRSPMALDIYPWLTHRMSYLKRPTVIPWAVLALQFGANYKLTRQFKFYFLEQLRRVTTIYPEADVSDLEKGLLLRPSPPHIARRG
jgi:Plasmid encoded RepA protein.